MLNFTKSPSSIATNSILTVGEVDGIDEGVSLATTEIVGAKVKVGEE